MNFLAPALLAGLAGLAIPVVAHLLGRERPRTIAFAAVRFLPRAEQSVTHRRALHDRVLLGVRLLLLALLVFILARPATSSDSGLAVVAEVHDAVIVIDGSRSMGLRVGNETMLQQASDRAETLLSSLPAGTRVGLLTSDPAGPRVEPSADPERVRAALRAWIDSGAPRPGAWQLGESVPVATSWLRDLDGDRKQVLYAVADQTAGGLGSLPSSAEGNATVIPISVTEPGTALPEHVGILEVDWSPAPDLDPRAVRVTAVVRRHGGWPASDEAQPKTVGLALLIGETEVARTQLELLVDQDTPVEFTHTLLDAPEAVAATVTLVDHGDDALPSDDRRHLWLSADEGLEVVVVNGDPSELRAHDEVFFLSTAVAAADGGRSIQLRSLAPDQLEDSLRKQGAEALAQVDVLVLANVRAPAPDATPAIIERVEAGMGLWIAVGDRVEPEAYNSRLGKLLPLRMREVVQVGTAPGRTEARVEGIAPADLSHPIFRDLGGDLGLSGSRTRRIVLLEPDPNRTARIALSFTSGAPALLTTEIGQGRVALLTTTIDRDWADLPLRPGFVPLMSGTLSYLGGAHSGVSGTRVVVGEPRVLRSDTAVVVRAPGGHEVSVAPSDDGSAVFRETFVPGHYRASVGEHTSVFAVEVEPSESRTAPVETPEAEASDHARQQVSVAVPRWRMLIVFVALLLGLEAVLRWRRRTRSHG